MKRFGKWIGGSMLIVASLFVLTSLLSCGGQGNKPGTPAKTGEEFVITFGVEPADKAKIEAKVDNKLIKSGDKVAKNKEVVFTLSNVAKGYELEKWEDNSVVKVNETTAKLKVTKACKVTAKLKTSQQGEKARNTITFSTDPENAGIITATIKEKNITVNSNDTIVVEGDVVEVTVTPKDASKEFEKWVSSEVSITNPKEKTITFTMPNVAVILKAQFKKNAGEAPSKHKVKFNVESTDGKDPEKYGRLKAHIKGGAKDGEEVKSNITELEKDTVVEFKLKVQKSQEGEYEYEFLKWEGGVSGGTTPEDKGNHKLYTATLTIGDADATVIAKIKPISASIEGLKLVQADKETEISKEFSSTDIQLASTQEGKVIDLDYAEVNGKKLKFIAVTEPKDATIKFNPEAIGGADGHTLQQGENVVTIEVEKVASTDVPEYKKITYKFIFKVSTPILKCAEIKLGDLYELTKDEIDEQAAGSEGFAYTFDKDQQPVKIMVTPVPSDAKVEIKKDGVALSDGMFTPEEEEKTVTIELSKDGYPNKTYTLKLKKAKEAEKHELKELTVGGNKLNANELENASSGDSVVINLKKIPKPLTMTWDSEATEVTVKINGGEVLNKTSEKSIVLPEKNGSDPYSVEVEITVKDGSETTTYKLIIQD